MIWTIPRCSLPRRAAAVASNYIKLLRKALVKAGYGMNFSVASLNFSGLEKAGGSGLPLTLPLIRKVRLPASITATCWWPCAAGDHARTSPAPLMP